MSPVQLPGPILDVLGMIGGTGRPSFLQQFEVRPLVAVELPYSSSPTLALRSGRSIRPSIAARAASAKSSRRRLGQGHSTTPAATCGPCSPSVRTALRHEDRVLGGSSQPVFTWSCARTVATSPTSRVGQDDIDVDAPPLTEVRRAEGSTSSQELLPQPQSRSHSGCRSHRNKTTAPSPAYLGLALMRIRKL